jgi:glycosyltransferase involved in cell wall biosynthesis
VVRVEISVIIPTKDRADKLEHTLLEYNNQTEKDFELILVVDGIDDKTKKLIDTIKPKLKYPFTYFIYEQNGGPARARNKGVQLAKGKYILFTGDDTYPDKNLLKEHLKTLTQKNGCLGFIDWFKPNEFMRWVSPAGAQFRYTSIKDPKNVTWQCFYTANISYPRSWHRLEQFDEECFKEAVMEDTDLGYRFYKRGLRIVLNKRAVVYHDHQYTLEQFSKRLPKAGY